MIILFIIAFGLSTDYGVFLLARIKEAHDSGADDRVAVATGLERSGRVVSAAALLFCAAVGSLSVSSVASLKEFGVGAALAVTDRLDGRAGAARAGTDGAARAGQLVGAGAAAPVLRALVGAPRRQRARLRLRVSATLRRERAVARRAPRGEW